MKTSLLLIVGLCLVAFARTVPAEHQFKQCAKATPKNCQTCRAVLYARKHGKCKKSENICKSIRDGDCPYLPNVKKSFPKFEYFTCSDQKTKEVLSVKNGLALKAEYMDLINWAEFDDNDEVRYKCALMGCCNKYPKGAFEPFPRKGKACINQMNTNVMKCADDGDCGNGWSASPEEDEDDDWESCNNKHWEWKPKEDSFIEKRSHHLRKN